MKDKINISVVLPVHELNETTKLTLASAIKSVELQSVLPDEVILVVPTKGEDGKPSDAVVYVKSEYSENKLIKIVQNDGATDFASQVNFGVDCAQSDWVSILEYDDEYANIWFKNVVEYRDAHPNVGLFMPIVVDVDSSGSFIGFTNEAVWANSFSDEMGILDLNALLAYQNFNIDGIVIKKEYFEEYGGFKPSIKLTFIYEFLLRMAYKDVRIMTIPKFGYKHVNLRPDSLFANYKQDINPVEARWWMSQAKKEYYFDKDRKITYDKPLV